MKNYAITIAVAYRFVLPVQARNEKEARDQALQTIAEQYPPSTYTTVVVAMVEIRKEVQK